MLEKARSKMDCTRCALKGCRFGSPCVDRSEEYLGLYQGEETYTTVKAASELVDGGRAGTLSRLEEIVEYAKLRGYRSLGVAYCYGMEKEAGLLQEHLKTNGFNIDMVSCTVDGVKEFQIDPSKEEESVSCNPLGQANVLNQSAAELTILMGLCLGHDILFQKQLNMDFTTWLVKDRVTKHRPLDALPGYKSPEDLFLETMAKDFYLLSCDQFIESIKEDSWSENMVLLDLRGESVFLKNGIPGSLQCLIEDLPKRYSQLLPDQNKEIILYCNGGMQSLYGVMYLSLKGYQNVKSLAGGYSQYLSRISL